MEPKYVDYQTKESHFVILFLVFIFVLFTTVVGTIANIFVSENLRKNSGIIIARIIITIFLFLYLYSIVERKFEIKYKLGLNLMILGNISGALLVVYPAGFMIYRTYLDICAGNGLFHPGCRNDALTDLRLAYIIAIYPLQMIIIQIVIKVHHIGCLALSAVVGFICIAIVARKIEAESEMFPLIVLSCFFVLVVFYANTSGSMKAFVSYNDVEASTRCAIAAENERSLMEMQSTELRHLIGNVAHDLKTPLAALVSELDGLVDDPTPSNRQKTVDTLRGVCSFMTMMINRSIDFTKVSSGFQLKPTLESVNIMESINWVIKCIECGRPQENVLLEIDPIPAEIHHWIISDKQWLLENLLCLTSNAVKFVSEGSITVRVMLQEDSEQGMQGALIPSSAVCYDAGYQNVPANGDDDGIIDLERGKGTGNDEMEGIELVDNGIIRDDDASEDTSSPKGFIRLEVEDTGIGISAELRNRLFRPFQQAQRRAGGTGLGLFALSQRIRSLGGSCGIADRTDGERGSRFWFTIPYRPDYSLSLSVNEAHRVDGGRDSEMSILSNEDNLSDGFMEKKSRILLVDDSILIQKTSSRALSREGFLVDVAVNGLECLKKTAENVYDVVLMDLQMPLMDGMEAIQRIRARENGSNGKIDVKPPEYFRQCPSGNESNSSNSDISALSRERTNSSNKRRLFVIGLSANSDSQSQEDALAAGMNAFIPKPLTVVALRECCRKNRIDLFPVQALSDGDSSNRS